MARIWFLIAALLALPVHAATTWNLQDVRAGENGNATGWFSFEEATNSVIDFRIVAAVESPLSGIPGLVSLAFEPGCDFLGCTSASVNPDTASIAFQRLSTPTLSATSRPGHGRATYS